MSGFFFAVTDAIAAFAVAKDPKKDAKKLKADAVVMLDSLTADMSSKTTARFGVYVVNQMFIRLYQQGIHIVQSQFLKLQEVAQRAEKEKISLFFAPCHRSHIDYMVLSYLFYRMGISLPFIAA